MKECFTFTCSIRLETRDSISVTQPIYAGVWANTLSTSHQSLITIQQWFRGASAAADWRTRLRVRELSSRPRFNVSTMIYTHVLNKSGLAIRSRLDTRPGNEKNPNPS